MRKSIILALAVLAMAIRVCGQSNEPLNFTAVNGPASISFVTFNTIGQISLQYSTDNCSSWSEYTFGDAINLSSGSKVYFKATDTNGALSLSYDYCSYFTMSGSIAADGNIMSLLDASMTQDSVPAGAFSYLFKDCTSLTKAPSLPATTLAECCYSAMFARCTSLTKAPSLPATTLADYCYEGMFIGCISLTQAPSLPATTLAEGCYVEMFANCSSLVVNTEAPGKEWMIQATTTATDALASMFYGTGGTMNGTPEVNTTYYIASDPTAAVEDVVGNSEYVVFAEGNEIVVKGASNVSISDASGRIVYDGKMNSEMERFEMPVGGIYFVRCDNKKSHTVMVK